MESEKLGKYLYETNLTLHKIILRRIEKDGETLPLDQLGQLIDIHLTLNDKINGYLKGIKQSELFNT
jgi:hypothetical protein